MIIYGENGDFTQEFLRENSMGPNPLRMLEELLTQQPISPGARVLDLFAGSGGIGIEALSRGAREAVFVENNPKAMMCVKDNLKFTKLEGKAVTLTTDVMNALYKLEGEKVFDYIFLDPPYDRGFEKRVLEYLSDSSLVYEDTQIIVEASKETDFSYLQDLGFEIIREKTYKTNKHLFIEKAGKEEVC